MATPGYMPNSAGPEPEDAGVTKCPKCGWSYAWDGRTCTHCAGVVAGCRPTTERMQLVLSQLRHPEARFRMDAARCLRSWRDSRLLPSLRNDHHALGILVAALGDSEPQVRVEAAYYLGANQAQLASDQLADLTRDDVTDVRFAASQALLALKDARGVDYLLSLVTDADSEEDFRAMSLLETTGEERVLDTLVAVADNRGDFRSYRAIIALGRFGSTRALGTLYSALKDEEHRCDTKVVPHLIGVVSVLC